MEDRMTAQKLKNSILQMAVQGKLVPQDPNDEPASVLLERIRKEKEQLIKEGKIKRNKNESFIFRGADNLHYEQIGKEVRCIEDELPFEIPSSWQYARLGSLLLKLTDGAHSTPKYKEKGVPFVSVKDISTGHLDLTDTKYISIEEHEELYKRCDPQIGDILLSKVGTTGIPVLVDTDVAFSLFVSVALLKFNHYDINPFYLIHLLSSPLVQNQCKENTKGVGNKNWVMRDIASTLVVIPPYIEQLRIVDKIKELEPLIDKYKQAEEKLFELNSNIKEQLKKSILQYAIEGKMVPQDPNDEPASVLLERIREEKQKLIAKGKIKKDKNESIIYRRDNSYYEKLNNNEKCIDEEILYSIPDLWSFTRQSSVCWLDNGILSEGERLPYLEAKAIRNSKEPEFKTSGVIVERTDKVILVDGENSGEVFNVPYRGYMGSTFKLLRQSSFMSEDYIQLIFELYRDLYKNNKKGAAIPHLNKELFKTLLIPIPPVKEQKQIVDSMFRLRSQIELL